MRIASVIAAGLRDAQLALKLKTRASAVDLEGYLIL